jgi:hypothetical protein
MARRIHYLSALALLLFILNGRPAWPQDTGQAGTPEPSKKESIRTVQLLVDPKPEPECALAYRLETPYMEQRPGNAALLYDTALLLVTEVKGKHPEIDEAKLDEWRNSPLDKLPQQDVREAIAAFEQSIHCLELASRCEQCVWEYPVRDEGLRFAMPPTGGFRVLMPILTLKARLEMADGDIDAAIGTLRVGLAAARALGGGPFTVQNLVGSSLARRTFKELEWFIQSPAAPNLYWAMTALPHPLLDMRRSLQMEMEAVYANLPELRRLKHEVLSDDEVIQIWKKATVTWPSRQDNLEAAVMKVYLVAGAMKAYPKARQYLLARGKTAEEVDSLPKLYVVLRYQHDQNRRLCDMLLKWCDVPYWQAMDKLKECEKLASEAMGRGMGDMDVITAAFSMSTPWIRGIYLRNAYTERDLAMLRCVEAIRMYAAGHDGKLPQALGDITEVPIPIDPVYGRAFSYQMADGRAVLESPAPPGESVKDGLRYEITIRKATK